MHRLFKSALILLTLSSVVCMSSQVGAKDREDKAGNANAPFSFALIGDAPYGEKNVEPFKKVINSINSDGSVRFVMHAGDIKAGSERCDDRLLRDRFELFQQFKTAFVFTPGDNEWTDCHRTNNGQYNPLERLTFLRKLFFPNPRQTTGGTPLRVESQALVQSGQYGKFVENVLFVRNQVMFATIHVIGSNNNLVPWSGIDPNDSVANPRADRMQEFQERERATIAWLDYVFQQAERQKAAGVFILMQANPNFELAPTDEGRAGFNSLIAKLQELTKQYGKPVVLAQGDNHVLLIDKPFYNYPASSKLATNLPNFTRIQAFGDDRVQWIKVKVDPATSQIFSFEEKIVNP